MAAIVTVSRLGPSSISIPFYGPAGVASKNVVRNSKFPPFKIGCFSSGNVELLRQDRKRLVSIVTGSTAEGSSTTTTSTAPAIDSWVPVIPISALPRGERRLIRQDGETVLLLWYKDEVFALENKSPAEGAYTEGLFNARLTADGCIVCPSTETTFDLRTGAIKDWYPTNPILAFLTRPTRALDVYPVKTDGEFVYINTRRGPAGESAEIVFGGQTQAGRTATDVSVDEGFNWELVCHSSETVGRP